MCETPSPTCGRPQARGESVGIASLLLSAGYVSGGGRAHNDVVVVVVIVVVVVVDVAVVLTSTSTSTASC